MFMQALRKKVDALAYHRSCLAAELARARDAVRAGVAENAALAARLAALTARAQGVAEAAREAGGGGAAPAGAA